MPVLICTTKRSIWWILQWAKPVISNYMNWSTLFLCINILIFHMILTVMVGLKIIYTYKKL